MGDIDIQNVANQLYGSSFIFKAADIYYLMFSWQVEFWLAKKVLSKFQGSRAVTENQ
jgi:hypothetical protein